MQLKNPAPASKLMLFFAYFVVMMDKQYGLYFKKIAAVKKDGKLNDVLAKIISKREKISG